MKGKRQGDGHICEAMVGPLLKMYHKKPTENESTEQLKRLIYLKKILHELSGGVSKSEFGSDESRGEGGSHEETDIGERFRASEDTLE